MEIVCGSGKKRDLINIQPAVPASVHLVNTAASTTLSTLISVLSRSISLSGMRDMAFAVFPSHAPVC